MRGLVAVCLLLVFVGTAEAQRWQSCPTCPGGRTYVVPAAPQTTSVAVIATAVHAEDYSDIPLGPGERLVAVDGRPVAQATATNVLRRDVGPLRAVIGTARNIVGNLVRDGRPFSHTPGDTALDKANYERARNGQGPLAPDQGLQQLALHKAMQAAARSYKNHVGGSLGGARCEGVGHTNGRFLSCCLDEPGRVGGAAMVQGRDGWYCCLLVR